MVEISLIDLDTNEETPISLPNIPPIGAKIVIGTSLWDGDGEPVKWRDAMALGFPVYVVAGDPTYFYISGDAMVSLPVEKP